MAACPQEVSLLTPLPGEGPPAWFSVPTDYLNIQSPGSGALRAVVSAFKELTLWAWAWAWEIALSSELCGIGDHVPFWR